MQQEESLSRISGNAVSVRCALRNKLLAALPEIEWSRVQRHLSIVAAPAGKTLCEPNSRLEYAYFPTTSIISLLHVSADGASTEIAMIGNEGLVGVTLFMDGGTTANRVVVQSKGQIFRLKGEVLQDEFSRGGVMQQLLLRYTQALLTQISQTAVCNRRHSIDQQLCRWILLSLDRLDSEELTMTHELLANTLGVRREGITEAARKLHNAGLITYRRGRITVTDRIGVEAYCCECYGVLRREYDRLTAPGVDTLHRTPLAPATDRAAPGNNGAERHSEFLAV